METGSGRRLEGHVKLAFLHRADPHHGEAQHTPLFVDLLHDLIILGLPKIPWRLIGYGGDKTSPEIRFKLPKLPLDDSVNPVESLAIQLSFVYQGCLHHPRRNIKKAGSLLKIILAWIFSLNLLH